MASTHLVGRSWSWVVELDGFDGRTLSNLAWRTRLSPNLYTCTSNKDHATGPGHCLARNFTTSQEVITLKRVSLRRYRPFPNQMDVARLACLYSWHHTRRLCWIKT